MSKGAPEKDGELGSAYQDIGTNGVYALDNDGDVEAGMPNRANGSKPAPRRQSVFETLRKRTTRKTPEIDPAVLAGLKDSKRKAAFMQLTGRDFSLKQKYENHLYSDLFQEDEAFITSVKTYTSKVSTNRVFAGNQMVAYAQRELTRISAFFTLRGTILADRFVFFQLIALFILMHVSAALTWIAYLVTVKPGFDAQDLKPDVFANSFSYLNNLMNFVLGLYVSLTLGRWWTMRVAGEDGLWNAITNISTMIGTYADASKDNTKFQQKRLRFARYALLAHRLMFMQARSSVDYEELLKSGLLMESEIMLLKDSPSKPLVVWGWLSRVLHNMFRAGDLPANMEVPIMNQVVAGRQAMQTISTHLSCQLPLSYTHIICLLVKVFLLFCSLEFGWRFGLSLVKFVYSAKRAHFWSAEHPYWVWALCVLQLVVFGVFYQGMINIQDMVSDPLGDDPGDFPMLAYQHFLRDETVTLLECGLACDPVVKEDEKATEAEAKPEPKEEAPVPPKPQCPEDIAAVLKELDLEEYTELMSSRHMNMELLSELPYPVLRDMGVGPLEAYKLNAYFEKRGSQGEQGSQRFGSGGSKLARLDTTAMLREQKGKPLTPRKGHGAHEDDEEDENGGGFNQSDPLGLGPVDG